MDDKDLFEDIAHCVNEVELMEARLGQIEARVKSLDHSMMMTLRGIMTLMEDLSFATLPSEGFTTEQKSRLVGEQIQARQRVRTTLEAMKKVLG